MSDLATQRLARHVRALRNRINWLAVGMVLTLALQSVTLGLWIDYEVRMHRIRQSLAELRLDKVAAELRHTANQLNSYRTSGDR